MLDHIRAVQALSGAFPGNDMQGRLRTANEIQDPERSSSALDAVHPSPVWFPRRQ
jgi:hypothetical protein